MSASDLPEAEHYESVIQHLLDEHHPWAIEASSKHFGGRWYWKRPGRDGAWLTDGEAAVLAAMGFSPPPDGSKGLLRVRSSDESRSAGD